MKDLISNDRLATIPDSIDRSRIHYSPHIPEDLLQTARKTFACTEPDEEAVLFIDTAPRGFLQKLSSFNPTSKPGSRGLLVTNRAIYDGSIWEHDRFLPDLKKRSIPLEFIQDIRVDECLLPGNKRILVNGIPLFGQSPPSFSGMQDEAFLNWCAKLLTELIPAIGGVTTKSVKNVVLSYQSVLAPESTLFGSGDIYYDDQIPSDYLENAIQSYVKLASADEEILLLYNDEDEGKKGIALSNKNLFSYASVSHSPMKWPLSEITRVWLGDRKGFRTTYLYVMVNEQPVFGWPHSIHSPGGRSYKGILRPTLLLAAMICHSVAVESGSLLSMPDKIIDLVWSEDSS